MTENIQKKKQSAVIYETSHPASEDDFEASDFDYTNCEIVNLFKDDAERSGFVSPILNSAESAEEVSKTYTFMPRSGEPSHESPSERERTVYETPSIFTHAVLITEESQASSDSNDSMQGLIREVAILKKNAYEAMKAITYKERELQRLSEENEALRAKNAHMRQACSTNMELRNQEIKKLKDATDAIVVNFGMLQRENQLSELKLEAKDAEIVKLMEESENLRREKEIAAGEHTAEMERVARDNEAAVTKLTTQLEDKNRQYETTTCELGQVRQRTKTLQAKLTEHQKQQEKDRKTIGALTRAHTEH